MEIKFSSQILHSKASVIMILHILHNFGRQVVRRVTEFRIGVKQIQDIQKVLLLLKRVEPGSEFFGSITVFINRKHQKRFNKTS